MNEDYLSLLCCPFCGGNFSLIFGEKQNENIRYGVLECYCGEYPIVEGIPILVKGEIATTGKSTEHIVSLIKKRQEKKAFLELLTPPYTFFFSPTRQLIKRIPKIGRIVRPVPARVISSWQGQASDIIDNPASTACNFLRHYFINRATLVHWYFTYRFSQSKHFVSLSLTSALATKSNGLTLDLGCGTGALTWVLQQNAKTSPVIGLDDSFHVLYVAKRWCVPDGFFVCAAADGSLPFRSGTFSAVYSSDAFHYFRQKATCISELKRITDTRGVIVLPWTRNALDNFRYAGLPLPVLGYKNLVAEMPHRLIADSDILHRYLSKQGPMLAPEKTIHSLNAEPTITILASRDPEIFANYGAFTKWPHSRGPLAINPLYRKREEAADGKIKAVRCFPSSEYETNHAESKSYLPETITFSEDLLKDRTNHCEEMAKLIDQFVLLGMPEKYGYPPIIQ
jgi:ubiquinone/menaquinone biosynthesis C-methylase UbiE/uncharacterized protein YbaR (Trm112 family)